MRPASKLVELAEEAIAIATLVDMSPIDVMFGVDADAAPQKRQRVQAADGGEASSVMKQNLT